MENEEWMITKHEVLNYYKNIVFKNYWSQIIPPQLVGEFEKAFEEAVITTAIEINRLREKKQ